MTVRDYSKWVAEARKAGLTPDQITHSIEEWMREDLALLRGLCPACGAPVNSQVDESVRGAPNSSATGRFVLYRCSRDAPIGVYDPNRPCGYAMDRWEDFE